MPQPGQIIAGKYRLDRLIGQGAFATVWAATNVVIDRAVALKILAEAPARKQSTVERFLKEARLCATPIHPTIVSVQDLGQSEGGLPYLVMELLVGHTLDRVLRVKGALPWAMVAALSRHLLEGLSAAHERGVIHRDIKPSNIYLVREPCGGPPLRILDLGLARDLSEEKRLTRTGQVVGTANYLPPETLLDEQPKGGGLQGDVFAVGMVMFVALTGRFPFVADRASSSPASEVYARAAFYKSRLPLPGPADYTKDLPAPLDLVVRRALAVDRAQRFADATAMLAAFRAAIEEISPRTSRVIMEQGLDATCFSAPPECGDEGEAPDEELAASEMGSSAAAWRALLDFAAAAPQQLSSSPLEMPKTVFALPAAAGGQGGASSRPHLPGQSAPPEPPVELPARSSRASAGGRSSRSGKRFGSWKGSRLALILIGSFGGALVGVALLVAITLWFQHGRSSSTSESLPAGGALEAPLVEVELRGLPPGARVSLDGRMVTGATLTGSSGQRARLEVKVAGFEKLQLEVTFQAGQVVDLTGRFRPHEPR